MSEHAVHGGGRKPVLVVGATGALGRLVVTALRARGHAVRALVRPGSDATALEAAGVVVVRGDMLDPRSLRPAFVDVDAVVTSAAGYTRRRKTDTADTDVTGNRNLADAAGAAGVRRFVFTGILRSDEARGVPHFWHKTLAERYLSERGVPYVSLRPGAFFDQIMDMLPGGGPRRGPLIGLVPPAVEQTYVLSADVADALATLVDADVADGEHVDLGWTRPLSTREIARLTASALGRRRVHVLTVPGPVLRGGLRLAASRSAQAADLKAMIEFFATGRYVADTTRQREVLGPVPTPEQAILRWAGTTPAGRT